MRNFHLPGRSNVLSSEGMAATSHPLASLEAISILKKGGNAVDAAIAASAVLSVVEPNATGIGGDCFAIIAPNGKNPISYNGSGICPEKLSIELFERNKLQKVELESPHSVTIPGAVHAWSTMHSKHGKLDFEQLFLSAIKYAQEGFHITEGVSIAWKDNEKKLQNNSITKNIFLKDGKSLKFKDKFKNIALANTLKEISKNGIKEFYNGNITKDIVNSLNELGGLHTVEDFNKQSTIVSDTLNSSYKDFVLHQCPPNGPGITVLLMMKMMERFKIDNYKPMSFERFHLQAEITKLAYKIREENLADPNFNEINIDSLLSYNNISNEIKKISMKDCLDIGDLKIPSHPETTYLTTIDKDLNTVSFINSICYAFGSGITTKKTGILLQNRGVNFRVEKNHPNSIEPLKRPLHTIIPGMIFNNKDQIYLSYGVMGGQFQPVGHTHVLNNIIDYNMNVQEAIDFPRAFFFNNQYHIEQNFDDSIKNKLETVGHKMKYANSPHGGGQAIQVDFNQGIFIGGSDPRKDGCALGL